MSKYNHHSLALTDKEQKQFEEVRKKTGFGVKKIFMDMINSLTPVNESMVDSINESSIILNTTEEE